MQFRRMSKYYGCGEESAGSRGVDEEVEEEEGRKWVKCIEGREGFVVLVFLIVNHEVSWTRKKTRVSVCVSVSLSTDREEGGRESEKEERSKEKGE